MVAAVQANLLFQSLNMTREELLQKYPMPLNNKEESMDDGQHSEGNVTVEPMQPFMQHFSLQQTDTMQMIGHPQQQQHQHVAQQQMANPVAAATQQSMIQRSASACQLPP